MKVTTFRDMMIKKLKPEDKKYIRGEGNGFSIRVMPSGVKTWLYVYALDGKRREMNLGSYPDVSLETARERFEGAKKKVKNGIDPIAEKEQEVDDRLKSHTVADLVKEYIEKHAMNNKKSWAEDKRCLEKEVVPLWGKRKAADIKKRDVVLLLEGIVERGAPVMANNTFEKVRKMFSFAVERDILEYTPCYGVKKPTKKEHKDRVLTSHEVKTVWNSIDTAGISEEIKAALKLILVTAQRPGEVSGMHTGEIVGNWWTIPANRAKNGKTHRVFMTPLAQEIICQAIEQIKEAREIPAEQEYSGYIFPCPHKKKNKPIEVNALAYAVRRNFASPLTDKNHNPLFNVDGTPAVGNRLFVDKFTPHDFRRTAATGMSELRFPDEVIDAVLNHVKKGVIAIYNRHGYDIEKQQALEAWERKLKKILGDTSTTKVVSIDSGRRKAI